MHSAQLIGTQIDGSQFAGVFQIEIDIAIRAQD